MKKLFSVALLLALAACGGGGGSGAPVLPLSNQANAPAGAQWGGIFRYTPASLTLSLGAPAMQYFYVDAVPQNGSVPDTQTFLQDFTQANPGVISGPCSAIAVLSVATISPNSYSGQQNPTVVISAYPQKAGACTQTVQLGAGGSEQFKITVTQ